METSSLAKRGKSLEDAFFAKQDAALRDRLLAQEAEQGRREELSRSLGIADAGTLDRLLALNLPGPLLAAISLAPLVCVAWADGKVAQEEHRALLAAAAQLGLDPSHAGHALLSTWLERPPPADLFESWAGYVAALMPSLSDAERQAVRTGTLDRARAVAEAARGFLNLGARVSDKEAAVMDAIGRALAS